MKEHELVGKVYGELTIESVYKDYSHLKCLCRCRCGKKKEVYFSNLKLAKTKSCGCKQYCFSKNDLTNQKFDWLTVKKPLNERDSSGCIIWECQCICGNIIKSSSRRLIREYIHSCGCHKIKKIEGKQFGQLRVIGEDLLRSSKKEKYWRCHCVCGNYTSVSQRNLISNHTKSCGCLQAKESRLMVEGTCINTIASNKVPKNNTSGYKGVSKSGRYWLAYISLKGKRYNLGRYRSIKEAIKARTEAERIFFEPLIKKYEMNSN